MIFDRSYFKKSAAILVISAFLSIFSNTPLYAMEAGSAPPFALITIPKSGSHMLIKALHLLTGGISVWHTRFPSFYTIPSNEGFLYTHFCLSPQLERDYKELAKLKKIISIRDLRDVCVSIVYQIRKSVWPGLSHEEWMAFRRLSFDEQLNFVINYEYDVEEIAKKAPNSLQVSVSKVAAQAIQYCNDSNNLVCKYEDLVGAVGGGSDELQMRKLRDIAKFLEISISESRLQEIAMSLYGDGFNPFGKEGFKNYGSTFKNGKIGSWKSAFNEENKIAFKMKLGQALIALGYEQDDRW
ncbi:MAG TPA: sulfotransferase domain-containing protein [Rhabdochlamydiaceae bacterium]|nr:sulfotransferase domain-containing protein [Rhabdochlamydiaceae bacterium]